jgi:hypothetical protein
MRRDEEGAGKLLADKNPPPLRQPPEIGATMCGVPSRDGVQRWQLAAQLIVAVDPALGEARPCAIRVISGLLTAALPVDARLGFHGC